MGLFDKFVKAAKTVGDFLDDGQLNGSNSGDKKTQNNQNTLNSTISNAIRNEVKKENQAMKKEEEKLNRYPVPDEIFATMNDPVKIDKQFGFTLYSDNGDRNVTFTLTEDFLDYSLFNHTAYNGLWVYMPTKIADELPDIPDDFVFGCPMVFSYTICEDDAIYTLIDDYKAGKRSAGVTPIDSGRTMFKAKSNMNMGRNIGYFYCYDLSDVDEVFDHCAFGVYYNGAIQGTPLERKLISIIDKAYASLDIN